MKHLYCWFIISLSVITASAQTYSFNHGGVTRSYIVHLPAGYSALNDYPVVLNFHGLTSTGAQQQAYTQMDKVADAEKFIVVYPDGVNNSWNAGINNADVDDIGFVNALLDTLIKKYSVDINRFYSTGLSMGGFFSYRLACQLSDRIAAIAPVAGTMTNTSMNACNPVRNVPVLHIHGTNDATVNYNGALGYKGADAVTKFWASANGCGSAADTTHLVNVNTRDNSTVDLIKYRSCSETAQVWLYKIYNGGHTWPDGAININGLVTNRDFNASREIWNFLKQFSLPVVTNMADVAEITGIRIYPNPAQHLLVLISDQPLISFTITDIQGKTTMSGGNEHFSTIDISGLERGVYMIKVLTEGGQNQICKFIKN